MSAMQYELGSSPCIAAFRSLKAGKTFFMTIVLLMLLVQLAAFIAADFFGVLDKPTPAAINAAATQPTTTQPGEADADDDVARAACWECLYAWTLPAAKFLALVAGLLAVLTFMFAVKLSIVGRLGGIAGFMSAFFWSLILLAVVTPWQQISGGSFASGALYNFGELQRHLQQVRAEGANLWDWIVHYARFIAYPVVAILIWCITLAKFGRGYRDSIMAPIITEAPPQPLPQQEEGGSLPMD